MLKETITYTDYNDNKRTEDFFFNLSKAELMEMEMGTTGGWTNWVKQIVEAQDAPTLVKLFKEIVLKAYGKKSLDGKRFIKSDELATEFSQTEAYSELYMKLVTDDKAASRFMNGIIPEGYAAEKANFEVVNTTSVDVN